MSKVSRRRLLTTGLATAAGASGLAIAAKLAGHYGLIPPDAGTIWGLGESLTYAAQRLLTRHSMAREFTRSQISVPFGKPPKPLGDEFYRLERGGFGEWRLAVDGMVTHPQSFTIEQLKSFPQYRQITHLACEEGWSYIAEWSGVRLSHVLDLVGTLPHARYVIYRSFQRKWWESIDMADALHPQTLLTLGINGGGLPVVFGGPLRMRLPRQLGYKNVKYLTRLTLTDDLSHYGKGFGASSPEAGYAWYAGI